MGRRAHAPALFSYPRRRSSFVARRPSFVARRPSPVARRPSFVAVKASVAPQRRFAAGASGRALWWEAGLPGRQPGASPGRRPWPCLPSAPPAAAWPSPETRFRCRIKRRRRRLTRSRISKRLGDRDALASYELRTTNYELRVTNYELRVTNYELRATLYIIKLT